VTGGSDHKVCIWNLLPAISIKYELGEALMKIMKGSPDGDIATRNGGKEESKEDLDGVI
jgi:hypothetical protein